MNPKFICLPCIIKRSGTEAYWFRLSVIGVASRSSVPIANVLRRKRLLPFVKITVFLRS